MVENRHWAQNGESENMLHTENIPILGIRKTSCSNNCLKLFINVLNYAIPSIFENPNIA